MISSPNMTIHQNSVVFLLLITNLLQRIDIHSKAAKKKNIILTLVLNIWEGSRFGCVQVHVVTVCFSLIHQPYDGPVIKVSTCRFSLMQIYSITINCDNKHSYLVLHTQFMHAKFPTLYLWKILQDSKIILYFVTIVI